MTKVIGIDFGTTYTRVAVFERGKAIIIPTTEGDMKIPSIVAFAKRDKPMVGQLALNDSFVDSNQTIRNMKRKNGTNYEYRHKHKKYSPEQITSYIFKQIKRNVETYIGEKVNRAVIAVPSYVYDVQKQSIKTAAEIAGLEILRILNETTAIALADSINQNETETILVVDIGGGSFSASVMSNGEGVYEVLSITGDTWLGGIDFDQKIADWIMSDFRFGQMLYNKKDLSVMNQIVAAAEKVKTELTYTNSTSIDFSDIYSNHFPHGYQYMTLTRAKFNELTSELLDKIIKLTRGSITDAGLKPNDIDRVLLAGGSTQIPAVKESIKKLFDRQTPIVRMSDDSVVVGAAVQAAILTGDVTDILLLEVIPMSLGIEMADGAYEKIIERNTTIPAIKDLSCFLDNKTSIPTYSFEINVLQGNSNLSQKNLSLGKYLFSGIKPLSNISPQISVTFAVDATGFIDVHVKEWETNRVMHIPIKNSPKMSEEELRRLLESV